MAKPPADADPEQFVIGRGGYDNFHVACPYWDEEVFRIDPAPIPFGSILVYNLIFVVFFGGLLWLGRTLSDADPTFAAIALACVGVLTCIGFSAVAFARFARENRQGPWLVYEKSSGRVELPRQERAFRRDEIVHLQYITTKFLNRSFGDDKVSELNLIASDGGDRHRWPLLRSSSHYKAFDSILRPLIRETDLPVVRVTDAWLGWNVREAPYDLV